MSIGRVPGATGIQPTIVDAKGDLIAATAADSVSRLVVGANETRLVAASGEATGLKYVADTTNYAVAAKGDLLAGTAADTVAALTVGANGTVLTADSAEATGLKWVGAAWTAFTPTWTNLTVGNGVYNQAHYSLIGKTATFAIDFSLGTTSAITGAVTLTLPAALARKNVYTTGPLYSVLIDTGTGDILGFPRVSTSNAQDYNVFAADDGATGIIRTQLSATNPFTWTSTDRIIYSGTIEVA